MTWKTTQVELGAHVGRSDFGEAELGLAVQPSSTNTGSHRCEMVKAEQRATKVRSRRPARTPSAPRPCPASDLGGMVSLRKRRVRRFVEERPAAAHQRWCCRRGGKEAADAGTDGHPGVLPVRRRSSVDAFRGGMRVGHHGIHAHR